jgi:hypothetical protein
MASTLTALLASPTSSGSPPISFEEPRYQPGVCNIGPAEIAKRRRAGHVGAAITIVALLVLVAVGAPPLVRLLIALPASVSASGYLQAYLKFCAGFGQLGVFNFEGPGTTEHVVDESARARDKARAYQISIGSGLIGLAIGVAAVLLPV